MMGYREWIGGLLSIVKEIADKDFQERVWLQGRGIEVSSWEEMLCKFFDDYDADNFVDNHMDAAGLSVQQQHAMKDLRDALNNYSDRIGDSYSVQQILDDSEWHRIRDDIAKTTLNRFHMVQQ